MFCYTCVNTNITTIQLITHPYTNTCDLLNEYIYNIIYDITFVVKFAQDTLYDKFKLMNKFYETGLANAIMLTDTF